MTKMKRKLVGSGLCALAASMLISGSILAQSGSALGELATEGQVLIERGTSSEQAATRDAVLDGDKVVTSGGNSGATIDFIEGGNLTLFGDSATTVGTGQLQFASSGGGCFSGLSSPVDVVGSDGAALASGVTSGAVFDGVFYATCPEALAALEAAGGAGLSMFARVALIAAGIAVGAEIVDDDDDDPVHGS